MSRLALSVALIKAISALTRSAVASVVLQNAKWSAPRWQATAGGGSGGKQPLVAFRYPLATPPAGCSPCVLSLRKQSPATGPARWKVKATQARLALHSAQQAATLDTLGTSASDPAPILQPEPKEKWKKMEDKDDEEENSS